MKKPRILVVGSFVMDLIVSTSRFPQSGETVLGLNYQTAPGGKGANQAVQAARLGAEVTMVGKVGKDAFGQILVDSAKASGVDVSRVAISETAPSAVGNVQLEIKDGQSANRIIVVSGANMTITPDDVAFLKEDIVNYDLVMLQLEIPMEINTLVASYAAAKGVPVMLNSAPAAPIPEDLLKNLSYISPNEHEARILSGVHIKSDDDVLAAVRELQKTGVKNVLITLGERGAAFGGADGSLTFGNALHSLEVKDTTAAGDSFVAAFCTAMCLGAPIEDVLAFANHTACITVSRMGAQPSLPTGEEVLAFLEKDGCSTVAFEGLKK